MSVDREVRFIVRSSRIWAAKAWGDLPIFVRDVHCDREQAADDRDRIATEREV
jgi:hypothetical protein